MNAASGLRRRAAIGLVSLAVLATGCGAGGGAAAEGPERPITKAAVVEGKAWQLQWVSEKDLTKVVDLAVVSADEAWAVGYMDASEGAMALLHGKGGDWEAAPLPDGVPPLAIGVHLEASSPDNVWLFWLGPGGASAARWDGSRWRAMPGDSTAELGVQDIAVLAPDDVWTLSGPRDASHWDGKRWRSVRLPAAANAIDGRASDDVWAVGGTNQLEEPGGQPVAMHWDGGSWQRTKLPSYRYEKPRPGERADLQDVAVISETEVWALGQLRFEADWQLSENVGQTFLMRWDGDRWWKAPKAVGGDPRDFMGAEGRPVIAGEKRGGVLLAGRQHWNGVDEVRTLGAPTLPAEYLPEQPQKYDQKLRLSALRLVPGERRVLGAGEVVIGDKAAGELLTRRAVIVSYELPE